MDKSNKIENLANKYVERHIRDRHLSDDTIKEIKIAYIMIRRECCWNHQYGSTR